MNMRLDIDKVQLAKGAHASPQDGLCIAEAVAYIAREQHSDHPACVSPVIAAFLRSWNDTLSDVDRQMLKPLIPVVMDTAGSPIELQASALALVERMAWLKDGDE